MTDKPGTVYLFYGKDDALLYIGASSQPTVRLRRHAGSQPWWREVARAEFRHFNNIQAARLAESCLIHELAPRYNVQDRAFSEAEAHERREQRARRFQPHTNTRLTPDDVRAIRASDESPRVLAARYGVSKENIGLVRRRVTWADLEDHTDTKAAA